MEPVEVLVTPTPTGGHLETGTPRSTTSSEQELAAITHSLLSTQVLSPMAVSNWGGGSLLIFESVVIINHACA